MSSLRIQTSCPTRRRSVLFLGFGVLSLTSVGVRCFAIGENRNNNGRKHGLVDPPSRVLDSVKDYRCASASSSTALWEQKKTGEEHKEEEAGFDSLPDSSMNFTGSEPIDFLVPPVTPVHAEKQMSLNHWPCYDKLDKELIRISLPVIGNFAINPLIGAVDLFWVNRMGNPLAVAGQAAANQVFSSAFWFVSFLPSITATLVSKQHASGDKEGTQDAICQALFVGFFIALIGTPLMFFNPDRALSAVLTGKDRRRWRQWNDAE
jgi:hypothetical protein